MRPRNAIEARKGRLKESFELAEYLRASLQGFFSALSAEEWKRLLADTKVWLEDRRKDALDEQDRLAGAWDEPASEDALEYAKSDPTEDAEPHEDDPEEGTPG